MKVLFIKENTNSNIKAEKSLNVVSPLKDFLKDNYSELANTISISFNLGYC